MNNDQFRKLVQNTSKQTQGNSSSSAALHHAPTPSAALGSRMRSSIPMTPRSIGGHGSKNEFARQLAERNAEQQPQKRFRSMAAPRGSKLGAGYVDRARAREDDSEENDKVQRVKALEEMMKLQQIDEPTFLQLREEILGKDVGERAGLVKGLDWTLLERVKKGEVGVADVLERSQNRDDEVAVEIDVDDEFDELEERAVETITKRQIKKKGEMAPAELTGRKRTRDQVLAEMKAVRLAAKEAAQPSLGAKFKKVGDNRDSRLERDAKGREVLITIDEHGNEKRKVRKVDPIAESAPKGHGLLLPDKDVKPLGMVVPILPQVEEVEEDDDIFADVGDDYDPLAGLTDEDLDQEVDSNKAEENGVSVYDALKSPADDATSMPPPPKPGSKPPFRNYFDTPASSTDDSSSKPKAFSDPTLLAAIKKASTINAVPKMSETSEDAAKAAKHRRMLENNDRDAQDMDMGFGSSRLEDEEDFEEKRVKLSEWGKEDNDDGAEDKADKAKRKRGGKKRKGDKNSAADVLGAMKRQKESQNT